jgi:UDP-N-acetylmuramate dehydrogenase
MSEAFTLQREAPLRRLNTMGVAASASKLARVNAAEAVPLALEQAQAGDEPVLVLGEGSNLLFVSDFDGLVLQLAFDDVRIVDQSQDSALVRVEAGHVWDSFVDWTLAQGLAGLENLALIPGLAGAAPIQNIGAYGVEVRQFLESVEAWDRSRSRFVTLDNTECCFGYRDSLFKRDNDRWVVTAVSFRLPRSRTPTLDYKGIGAALTDAGIRQPTASDVAAAVRRLRRAKLPYPDELGNAGSFFKNPVIADKAAQRLSAEYAELPVYPAGPGEAKISAAWLIEYCGWRGHRQGDAGIALKHALVLVNHGAATGRELLTLARRVADSVEARFGIRLEPEPRIIGECFGGS